MLSLKHENNKVINKIFPFFLECMINLQIIYNFVFLRLYLFFYFMYMCVYL